MADDDITGRTIRNRYKLIDKLAKGTFGTVYIVRDLQTNYLYAIKILHFNFLRNHEVVTRFMREAYLPLSIDNPHIVRVIDYGEDGGIYFIVMDYIDGQSLKYVMVNFKPLEVRQALNYMRQITEGLDAAHKSGVIHRDLKPQNILVNNKGEIKITDFGLARSQETPTITDTDEFLGTAYYISPEQIDSGHAADIRADLYSVATIFYEMLAGHPPFEGNNVMDILIKHKNENIQPVSHFRSDLPPDIDQFFQKALAKQPAQRYQTPAEFQAALDHIGHQLEPQKRARLVLVSSGQAFLLTNETTMIGRRDPTQNIYPDISLVDEQKLVGRSHARVWNHQGAFAIEDLNSVNKTRLNGEILEPNKEYPLKESDIVRVGTRKEMDLRFEYY